MTLLAFAQETAPITVGHAGAHFVIAPIYWTFIAGAVLPYVQELVQKVTLKPILKQILMIVLATLATFLIRWTQVDGSGVFDQAAIVDFFVTASTALLSHRLLVRNTRFNGGIAPGFGLG